MRKPKSGPLQGIRILDLTRLLPGPLGTMLMADMGAEVIKVEDPKHPDMVRNFPPYKNGISLNYLALNRSKLSMALDFSSEEDKKTFFELVKTADVVIEQFRPKFMDKLGIGYEEAKKHNEKIIYVSITGYGQSGIYSHLAGHDINYTAIAGVLGMTGKPDEPINAGVQLADVAGGSYMAVIATLSAIYARIQTGVGQQVDVSMTDSIMPFLALHLNPFGSTAELFDWQNKRGLLSLSGGLVNYGVYKTSDSQFIALGTLEPKFWQKFCNLVQKPHWMSFLIPESEEKLGIYKNEISELIASNSVEYWIKFGFENDILITKVNEINDLKNDPYLKERQMIIEEEHPKIGKFDSIGVPLKFSETPAKPAWTAPELGEDTDSILDSIKNK